jgi:hypothetical protein
MLVGNDLTEIREEIRIGRITTTGDGVGVNLSLDLTQPATQTAKTNEQHTMVVV